MTVDAAMDQPPPPGAQGLRSVVINLSPAYFAMVMATGIVSTGAYLFGFRFIALPLLWLNILVFVTLWILNILRVLWFAHAVAADLTNHERGPGFFTAVAASCILGSQFIVILGNITGAIVLGAIAVVLWLGLTYSIFAALTIRKEKPPLHKGISGAWLLAVVATQSLAVLSALIAAHWQQPFKLEANFFALSMWLWGGMLYIWMISLIFYRYTFFEFAPGDLSPPYWINMGAMAISTLAGSLLVMNTADAPLLQSILPFIKGFTVLYWATGTWWIPMLFILAVWRYVYKKFPLRYDPLYWGAVFPLGMYAVCTYRMAEALKLSFLYLLPKIFLYIALVAWAAAFLGLLYTLTRRMLGLPLSTSN